MRTALLAVLLTPALGRSARAQSTATLRGVDAYRSAILTSAEARRRFEPALLRYVSLNNIGTPAARKQAESLRAALEREAAGVRGVAYARLRVTEHYTSSDHALYALFDVVDRADAGRLTFAPAPRARLPDPDGLIAAWRAYVARGEALSLRGEMTVDRPKCPGFYCLWGGTPELDAAQKTFVAGAVKNAAALRRILRADADGADRADALFVLSYSPSGAGVTALCRESLADSDERVRGAALQILADVANRHPELPIGLDVVLPRLDDPSGAVRGKVMGLLVPLAERPAYRQVMTASVAPRLAALLKLSQPESRDLAFTLLGLLSKQEYRRDDFADWDAWAARASAGTAP